LRVAHWAWILAREEKADIERNVIAALFHDVSHFVSEDYRKHGEKSAEIAMDFMQKAGVPKDFADDVSYAVKSHVGERNLLGYLEKIERGEFGPMWTKTGKEKVEEFINLYKAVYGEILSEIESTKTPETYV